MSEAVAENKDQELAALEKEIQGKINGYVVVNKAIDVERAKTVLTSLKGIVNKVVEVIAKDLEKRQADLLKMKADIEKLKI